jgi:PST family polysaccharide transporter/lipopolysaccharide exporter
MKFSDDKKRLVNAFAKVTLASSTAAIVLGVIIFIFANLLVRIILGPGWESAVPVVKILAIYGILRASFANFSALFLSVEKQGYVATMTFIRLLILAILIVPLVNNYGMNGAAYAMLASIIFEIPVILFFTRKTYLRSN